MPSESLDLVIANAENAAGGSGLTPQFYQELVAAGVDAITLGDHVYRRKEICKTLEAQENIVRPANLPAEAIGRRWSDGHGRATASRSASAACWGSSS